jgi:hypothetical protein
MEQTALATVLIADADMLGLVVRELYHISITTAVVLKRVLVLVDIIPHIEKEYVVIVLLLIHALDTYADPHMRICIHLQTVPQTPTHKVVFLEEFGMHTETRIVVARQHLRHSSTVLDTSHVHDMYDIICFVF